MGSKGKKERAVREGDRWESRKNGLHRYSTTSTALVLFPHRGDNPECLLKKVPPLAVFIFRFQEGIRVGVGGEGGGVPVKRFAAAMGNVA